MKIKEESKELQRMIESSISGNLGDNISDVPEELEDPKPLIDIDFKTETKKFRKKARNSIIQMIDCILPQSSISSKYIQDKINQDAEQLGKLYYQEYLIEVTQQIQVDSLTRGNISPRMFEVFATLSKNHSEIAKQISEFQTILRKSYIDIKYDLKNAKEEDEAQPIVLTEHAEIPANKQLKEKEVFLGTKDLVLKIQEKRKNQIMKERKSSSEESLT